MRSDDSDANADNSADGEPLFGIPPLGGRPQLVGALTRGWMERFTVQRAEWQRRTEEQRVAFFDAGGQCWACRDTGYVNGWQGDGCAPCEACPSGETIIQRLRGELVARTLATSGVPQRFATWSFETFPATARKRGARVQRFAEQCDLTTGRGLFLTGGPSVGKTGLLVSALRRVIERHVAALEATSLRSALDDGRPPSSAGPLSVWFTTDAALLDGLRAGYADATFVALMQRAITVPLLIVDDFGKADYKGGSGWAAERLYSIINARYADLRPTWFSSNFGAKQLEKERLGEMGEPIMDRVLDACEGLTITGAKLRMGVSA